MPKYAKTVKATVGDDVSKTTTQTNEMPDALRDLSTPGIPHATVAKRVSEKLNGPEGSFSTLEVSVEITIECDQNMDTVRRASELLTGLLAFELDLEIENSGKAFLNHIDLIRG